MTTRHHSSSNAGRVASHGPASPSPETSADAPVAPIAMTEAQELHATKTLKKVVALFNAMFEHGRLKSFPADLPPATVRRMIVDELDSGVTRAAAGGAQSSAVGRRSADAKAGGKLLRRMKKLVDAAYPAGHPSRAAFFPGQGGVPTLASRLEAMAQGLDLHGLPEVPGDISSTILVTYAHALAHDDTTRVQAGAAKKNASGAHATLSASLQRAYRRLVKALKGFYGEESPELVKFGIKPAQPRVQRRLTDEEKAARKAASEQKKKAEAEAKAMKEAERARKAAADADQKAADAEKKAQTGGTDSTPES